MTGRTNARLVDAIDGKPDVVHLYRAEVDEKGKLELPPLPDENATAALCQWLTTALNLDPRHPITAAKWQGVRGPDGHVALQRAGAPEIRFEPVTKINAPMRLIEAVQWQRTKGDGPAYAYQGRHCRVIAHAVACLCDVTEALTARAETEGIVAAYVSTALRVDGCLTTYGTSAQRYEAAEMTQRELDTMTGRPIGPPKFFVDANTGELVIRVSDLAAAARQHLGSGVARGWLDGRMASIGWTRVQLSGYEKQGREGRAEGGHLRVDMYRGLLLIDGEDPVNT